MAADWLSLGHFYSRISRRDHEAFARVQKSRQTCPPPPTTRPRFERLTTVTNILLLNLVISCLLFMSSLPLQGIYLHLSEWIFGKVMCKIYGCLYYLGLYSSVLFLTLLTFDRHLAVVYSLSASRLRSRRYAVLSCLVVWLVSCTACFNHLLLHSTFVHHDNKTYCDESTENVGLLNAELLRNVMFYMQIFLFLLFPLVVIIYCYVRIGITVMSSRLSSKFKTMRLIFVIVVLFFLCWTPFNVVELLNGSETSCEGQARIGYAAHITRNLASLYFCICPLFYTFVGRKFQNYFRQMLVKRFPALQRHISVTHSRTTASTKNSHNDL